MTDSLAIGVDFGATKIATALVTYQGEVLASHTTATSKEQGVDSVLNRIAREINRVSEKAEGDVLGIGIGVPGLLRPTEGILVYSTNLGWNYVNVAEGINANLRFKLPIWVQTDTNACILGEYFFGVARGCRDFVYTSIGSGLGGALICNGQLVTGANNMAGFLGLYSLDPKGRPDPSGLRGNTEAVVSGRGLVTLTRELLAEGRHSTRMQDSEELSPESIVQAAREGDELAHAAFTEMGRCLGEVWTHAVAVLNPAKIVLGGGIGLAAFDLLVPVARAELEARLSPVSYADLEIVPSRLRSSAVGAACLVFGKAGAQLPRLD
ncbi:MAG: ROK family protein [Candidatus Hydrogenedentota bacterium]|nr:MAG: ROK family protein [Candidatus Hydrogenedentota bacterium]